MNPSLSTANYSTHSMDAARCSHCSYYHPRRPQSGGHCRRRPPVVMPGTAGDKCFPIVKPDDWCGAFEGAR